MNFHGRGLKLVEIYLNMAGIVENMKNILLNNFKMLETTFNS